MMLTLNDVERLKELGFEPNKDVDGIWKPEVEDIYTKVYSKHQHISIYDSKIADQVYVWNNTDPSYKPAEQDLQTLRSMSNNKWRFSI